MHKKNLINSNELARQLDVARKKILADKKIAAELLLAKALVAKLTLENDGELEGGTALFKKAMKDARPLALDEKNTR